MEAIQEQINISDRENEKNEKNGEPSTTMPRATPHHHPLIVEGRPQPTRLRSVARTARGRPALRTESDTYGRTRRSGCVLRRGSGQPAPPSCRSRLRRLPLALRAYTASALGAA